MCSLLLEGAANKNVADRLDIALRTVEKDRATAIAKLQLGKLPLLVWCAIRRDYLPDAHDVKPIEKDRKPRRSHATRVADPTPEEIHSRVAALREGSAPYCA